jgi:hypothetical protein
MFEMEINEKDTNDKTKGNIKEGDIIAKKVIKIVEKIKGVKNSMENL